MSDGHIDENLGYDDAHVTEISVEFQPAEHAGDQKEQGRSRGIKRKFVKFWKKRKRSWSSLRGSMKNRMARLDEERELVAMDAAEVWIR